MAANLKSQRDIKSRPGVSGAVFDTIDRWSDLGLGVVVLAARFSNATYELVAADETTKGRGKKGRVKYHRGTAAAEFTGIPSVLPGAILGMGLGARKRSFDAIANLEARLQEPVARAAASPAVAPVIDPIREFLKQKDAEYRATSQANVELAADFLAHAGPQTLDELLARIDIDMVVDRVDVDFVIDQVDLSAVINKIPVDQVIEKIDLRAVVLDTVGQVQVSDILRESTNSTARALRGQVSNATRNPFRKAVDS